MADVATDNSTSARDATGPATARHGLRPVIDALLCLAFAVILVRSFAVEGYMISTGSMAPTLPGFHKRVTCPSCHFEFAVGISDDGDAPSTALGVHQSKENFEDDNRDAPGTRIVTSQEQQQPHDGKTAVCPNCGRHAIDLDSLPRNQGDQLLVYKNAYQFRPPRRWEVVVFRNPSNPSQAYVKRVAGLPGEQVEIINGDLWINGTRQRKELSQQRAMRILVYDHNFEPMDDADWKPRWIPEDRPGHWQRAGRGFTFSAKPAGAAAAASHGLHWVTYRHWIRDGGSHRTRIRIPENLRTVDFGFPSLFPARFDPEKQELWHRGVLSAEEADRIGRAFQQEGVTALVRQLAENSHLAPIEDEYGYNRTQHRHRSAVVRDLMLSCRVSLTGANGTFAVEMTDGQQRFRCLIDTATRELSLQKEGDSPRLRTARLKADVLTKPMRIELSLFDRQVLVVVNDVPVFEPFPLDAIPSTTPAPRTPVRIGATNLEVRVDELQLYRDIYYTKKGEANKYPLSETEYFVLGDNSPISADSRVWDRSGVDRQLFLGKPFLVHLPSKPGLFRLGKFEFRVRIPDLSRIRYIR